MVARARRAAGPRALPRPAARSCAAATCSSSTSRRRCPPRSSAPRADGTPVDAAPLDAGSRRARTAGSSSCAATASARSRRPLRRAARARRRRPRRARRAVPLRRPPVDRRARAAGAAARLPRARTARRSATRTSLGRGRSRITRRSSRACPAARRCRAPGGRSRRACWRGSGRGIGVAPLVLHTGVSSLERGERPYPERFEVPATTAARVNAARAAGGRVIAVGTTVDACAGDGRGARRHGPRGCGLDLADDHARARRARRRRPDHRLARARREPPAAARGGRRARSGRALLRRRACDAGYRWHEFGDSHLLLRGAVTARPANVNCGIEGRARGCHGQDAGRCDRRYNDDQGARAAAFAAPIRTPPPRCRS